MWPEAAVRYGLGKYLSLRILSEDLFYATGSCVRTSACQDPDRLFKASFIPKYPQLTLYRFAAINPSLEDGDDQGANSVVADSW